MLIYHTIGVYYSFYHAALLQLYIYRYDMCVACIGGYLGCLCLSQKLVVQRTDDGFSSAACVQQQGASALLTVLVLTSTHMPRLFFHSHVVTLSWLTSGANILCL
jgi:hypothetical protein